MLVFCKKTIIENPKIQNLKIFKFQKFKNFKSQYFEFLEIEHFRFFVGSWVALGFVWVSFPRATSEGFSFSKLIAGVETRVPRRTAQVAAQASAQ